MDKEMEHESVFKLLILIVGILIAASIFYTGNKLSLESELKTCAKVLSKHTNHVISEGFCMDMMIND